MLSFLEPSSRAGFWLVTHWPLYHVSDTVTIEYYKKNSLSLSTFLKTSLRRMANTQTIYTCSDSTTRLYFSEARPADDYARFHAGYRTVCEETIAKGELLTAFTHHKAAKKFCCTFDEKVPGLVHNYDRYDDFLVVVMQRCFSLCKFYGNCTTKSNATKFGLFCEDFQALLRGDITLQLPCKRFEPLSDTALELLREGQKI